MTISQYSRGITCMYHGDLAQEADELGGPVNGGQA